MTKKFSDYKNLRKVVYDKGEEFPTGEVFFPWAFCGAADTSAFAVPWARSYTGDFNVLNDNGTAMPRQPGKPR